MWPHATFRPPVLVCPCRAMVCLPSAPTAFAFYRRSIHPLFTLAGRSESGCICAGCQGATLPACRLDLETGFALIPKVAQRSKHDGVAQSACEPACPPFVTPRRVRRALRAVFRGMRVIQCLCRLCLSSTGDPRESGAVALRRLTHPCGEPPRLSSTRRVAPQGRSLHLPSKRNSTRRRPVFVEVLVRDRGRAARSVIASTELCTGVQD
jgi:hypothetical protein